MFIFPMLRGDGRRSLVLAAAVAGLCALTVVAVAWSRRAAAKRLRERELIALCRSAKPLQPRRWPYRKVPANRRRLYDFYAKQAVRALETGDTHPLLEAFPGLDHGRYGHWGRFRTLHDRVGERAALDAGPAVATFFHYAAVAMPKAVCVKLGNAGELSACIDPAQRLSAAAVWRGPFLHFAAINRAIGSGSGPGGELLPTPRTPSPVGPGEFRYRGYYRCGPRTVFVYDENGERRLASPWVENGELVWRTGTPTQPPVAGCLDGGPSQWPQRLDSSGRLSASHRPYVIDTLRLPHVPESQPPLLLTDHDFFDNGDAAVCTIHGDVWIVSGIDDRLEHLTWKRFAAGLNEPVGLRIVKGVIHVVGRDQVTRLHDLNHDQEADFYECVGNAFPSGTGLHDFTTGLQCDAEGRLLFASPVAGVCRLSPGTGEVEALATGLRNPNGLALGPRGEVTVSPQEGDWTPASAIVLVRSGAHYGYGGPREGALGQMPPLCYLPRGIDHSSGGQTFVEGDRWGPLSGQLIHFSYGTCTHALVLRQSLGGTEQGAVVPLPGEFKSGVQRGRFHPVDGQLYASGLRGWGTYAAHDGCFQRVRYTGRPVQLPVGFEVRRNGVLVRFSRPLDPDAGDRRLAFAQQWQYQGGPMYGSPEFSRLQPGHLGHDRLEVSRVHRLPDGRSVFLEIPQINPVHQVHLHLDLPGLLARDLFLTIHELGPEFTDLPGYHPVAKQPLPEWKIEDLVPEPNPWTQGPEGRPVSVRVEAGFRFQPEILRARAGERLSLTLENPDAMSHNLVLLANGATDRVGRASDRLLHDRTALAQHYVPHLPEVLAHTSLVGSAGRETIHFNAPDTLGRYPFICSFPGHWRLMRGVLEVE